VAAGLIEAEIALERERLADAARLASAVQPLTPRLPERVRGSARAALQLVAGTAEARSGKRDAARRRLDADRAVLNGRNDTEIWLYHALEGEIALAAGDHTTAATAFAAGSRRAWFSLGWGALLAVTSTLSLRDGEARVKIAAGDRAGALLSYQRLLTPSRDQRWIAALEPRFVLARARLLDRTDPVVAREEYSRFLTLWAHADADLPELAEAKRRLRLIPAAER
jgi:hypothetical protein